MEEQIVGILDKGNSNPKHQCENPPVIKIKLRPSTRGKTSLIHKHARIDDDAGRLFRCENAPNYSGAVKFIRPAEPFKFSDDDALKTLLLE